MQQPRRFVGGQVLCLGVVTCLLAACSDSKDSDGDQNGGTAGAATSSGGNPMSGGSGGSTGGSVTGGTSAGGAIPGNGGRPAQGGTGSGGAARGGAFGIGGVAMGGAAAGGAANGGQAAGGTPAGGSGNGGMPSGGSAAGGMSSGGSPVGGAPDGGTVNAGGSLAGSAGAVPIEGGASSGGTGEFQGGAGGEQGGNGGEQGGAPPADATIIPDPSWDCGMPDGIVSPTRGELVLSATLELREIHEVGTTPYGERRFLDVSGGSMTGDGIDAQVMTGGMDLELTLSNGSVELEQINVLQVGGAYVLMRVCGVAAPGDSVVRIVPDFEIANNNSNAWLNTGEFVGTRVIDEQAGTIELSIYDVSGVTGDAPEITITDPTGVDNQPWNCAQASGSKGDIVLDENVGIGNSQSVGESKRGNRNIIPITGGSFSGRLTGTVLPGGADFQMLSGTATLDARYTLQTDDDEIILVRNCGPMGAMVPTFEAPTEGAASFLNANTFLADDPQGGGAGAVRIVFHERL